MAEGSSGPEVKTPPSALSQVSEKTGQVAKGVGAWAAEVGTTVAGRSLGLSGIAEEVGERGERSVGLAILLGVTEFLAPNILYAEAGSAEWVPRFFGDLAKIFYSLGVGTVTTLATGEVVEGLKAGLATNLMLNAASHAISMPIMELKGAIAGRQSPIMPSYQPASYQQ